MPYLKKENNSYKESDSGKKAPFVLQLKRGSSTTEKAKNTELLPGEVFFEKDTGFLYINNNLSNKKVSELNPVNIGYIQNIEVASSIVDENIKIACVKKDDSTSLKEGILYYRTLNSITDYLSENIKVVANQLQGTVSISSGGTGAANQQGAFYNLLNNLQTKQDAIQDNSQLLLKSSNNFSETDSIYYKEASSFVSYIEKKINLSNITNGTLSTENLSVINIEKGGTGATTEKGAEYALIGGMSKVTSEISDDNVELVYKYTSPSDTTGVLYSRTVGSLANYITNKIPVASYIGKGTVQIGNGISVSDGTISVTKDNIIGQLGYTPPNMSFDAGDGYLLLGGFKICWGQMIVKYAATSTDTSTKLHYYGDSTSITYGTFPLTYSFVPRVTLTVQQATTKIYNVELSEVTTTGITKLRIHRESSFTDNTGLIVNYIAIGF